MSKGSSKTPAKPRNHDTPMSSVMPHGVESL